MDSHQIEIILRRNNFTRKIFKGVFASNEIKLFDKYPYCFVATTDKAGSIGSHWLAFYVPNSRTVEYFDSLGEQPNNDIKSFLEKFKNIKLNKSQLQASYENSCGPHAIYFLVNRCMGKSFDLIIQQLNNPLNDILVKYFIYKLHRT